MRMEREEVNVEVQIGLATLAVVAVCMVSVADEEVVLEYIKDEMGIASRSGGTIYFDSLRWQNAVSIRNAVELHVEENYYDILTEHRVAKDEYLSDLRRDC